jgi:hypothetical protein
MSGTGGRLPIVFQQKTKDIWVVLAIALGMLAGGIAMAFDTATLVSVFGLFHVPRARIGWPVALLGLAVVLMAGNALARGLPRLELREEGIVLRGRFGGTTRIAWREVERVDVQHMETMGAPNVAGTVTFDSVAIVLTDGRKVAISELGPAEEMRREIMRARGRYCCGNRNAIGRRPSQCRQQKEFSEE